MLIYLPRFQVTDFKSNLAALHRDATDAREQHCDVVMFPELFLTGYRGESELQAIQDTFFEASSAAPGMLCIFGTVSEEGKNRLWAYCDGQPIAHYDKVHLFAPNGEFEIWTPGTRYVAVQHGGHRIGLAICNDVRFPEQVRALKLKHNIDMAAYPSVWPWERDHVLAALLRARAVENGIFVAGCCVSGIDNGLERFDGAGNHVFDPLGNEIRPRDRVYKLDFSLLDSVIVDTRERHVEITDVDLQPD